MFDLFELDAQTNFGRIGKIKFDKTEINTPINSPTHKEFEYMKESPHVNDKSINKFKLGVQEEWFYEDRMERWKKGKNTRDSMIDYIKSKNKKINSKINLLNLRFGSNIKSIKGDILTSLLELQRILDVDVIQTPNLNKDNYQDILDKSIEWRITENIDKPIMGMINDMESIDIISKYEEKEKIDCFGINSRYPKIPLLEKLKAELQSKNVWIHAFSTPHTYYQLDYKGTLGILNNYYGIDTFNHFVAHPKLSQKYALDRKEMDEEEKQEEAQTGKFLKPDNYGTPEFISLESQYGPEKELSDFCSCDVCQENTIDTMLSDYEYTHFNERSHEALSYALEADNIRENVKDGKEEEYINSKEYPKRFIH